MSQKVWVFIVDTKHGTDVSVYATKEAADRANHEYCDQWWDREFGAEKRPLDEMIAEEYWSRMSDRGEESCILEEYEVQGADDHVPA